MIYRIATLFALIPICACNPGNSEKASPPKLFAEQREALDKAKTVAPEQKKQDEEQRKAIDEQTK